MTIYELKDKVFGSLAWEPVTESAVCDKWRNHCCEHFMAALEALKLMTRELEQYQDPADKGSRIGPMRRLIAKLEKVKA